MSNNGGRGSGIGDRDRFDEAIDRAVREMLDVEPPAGLRGRVLDRIDALNTNPVASAFRRNIWWLAGPVATAAVLVLAVLAPWRSTTETVPPPFKSGGDTRLAVESAPVPPPSIVNPRSAAPTIQVASRSSAPSRGLVRAADVAGEDVNFTAVDVVQALAGPEAIAVERLTGPPPSSLPSIEPAPLEIRALQISALPETPRERREE